MVHRVVIVSANAVGGQQGSVLKRAADGIRTREMIA